MHAPPVRVVWLLLAALSIAGIACGAPRPVGPVAQECEAFHRCVDKATPDFGARSGDFAEGGRCWTTTAEVAQSCIDSCVSGHANLRMLRPDAGC